MSMRSMERSFGLQPLTAWVSSWKALSEVYFAQTLFT